MVTLPNQAEQRFVLHGVSWQSYQKLLEALGERRLRHAYDGWNFEMMSPSQYHEWVKKTIGRLIEATSLELAIPIKCVGSTTLRNEGTERGLEPDETYYIANEAAVRGRFEWDPAHDPPPDLAVEVDIHSSSVDRMQIYHALGIPEVWRVADGKLQFHVLAADGYRPSAASQAFGFLAPSDLLPFLAMEELDDMSLVRSYLQWLRKQPGTQQK